MATRESPNMSKINERSVPLLSPMINHRPDLKRLAKAEVGKHGALIYCVVLRLEIFVCTNLEVLILIFCQDLLGYNKCSETFTSHVTTLKIKQDKERTVRAKCRLPTPSGN